MNLVKMLLMKLILIISFSSLSAQWQNYNTNNSGIAGNSVSAIVAQSDGRMWIGDGFNGLTEYNNNTWTVYNTGNSGMPINGILRMGIAPDGKKWIATNTAGIAVFDDNNWTIYNQANTGQAINFLQGTIAFENSGSAWFGTGGLINFDGNNWTLIDPTNSNMQTGWYKYFAMEDNGTFWSTRTGWGQTPYLYRFNVLTGDTATYVIPGGYNWTEVFGIDFDGQRNLWFITLDGLFKFDGNNWTHFHTSNSDIPANDLRVLFIDSNDNIWMGTFGVGTIYGDGLLKYDGNTFTQYTIQNSGLPSYSITALEEDVFGNLWIGHGGDGVTVFQGATVSVNENNINYSSRFELDNNYPNPFNPATTISFQLPGHQQHVSLKVYDITGKEIATLINGEMPAGAHQVQFNAESLASGIYFYQLSTSKFTQTRKMMLVK